MSLLRKILCAVDFEPHSLSALKIAREALPPDGKLHVLHIVTFPYALTAEEAVTPLADTKERLEGIVREHLGEEPRCEVLVEAGDDTVKSILEAAERLSAGCIVVATRNKKGLERFLLGSVAEKITQHSPVPVITIRPH
ncbi:MAG TPA: universal stress protein [Candidatus Binataceae bacterium]|nr:universal stress protein [Candidatus Binataceae bacterium]